MRGKWRAKEYVRDAIWEKIGARFPKAEIASQDDDLWYARARAYADVLARYKAGRV